MDAISRNKMFKKQYFLENQWTFWVYLLLIAGAACVSYQYVLGSRGYILFFYDIILDQTNGLLDICILIPFAWILVAGCPTLHIYDKNYQTSTIIKNIFAVNIICLLGFIVVNIIIYLLFSGFKNPFLNYWIADNQIYRMGFTPFSACCASVLLFFIRMTFFSLLSYTVSTIFKNRTCGFVSVLIICLLDWKLYEWLKIYEPLGVLPVEHSRIIFTEGYAPMSISDTRIPFTISILYWIMIYAVEIFLFTRFRSKRMEVSQNE